MPTKLVGKIAHNDAKDAGIFSVMVDKSIRILREKLGIYKGNERKFVVKQYNPKAGDRGASLSIYKRGKEFVGDFVTYHNEKDNTIEFYIRWKELKNDKRRKHRVFKNIRKD